MRMDVAFVVLGHRISRNDFVTESGQCKGDSNANNAWYHKAVATKSAAGHNMSKAYAAHLCFSPVSIPTVHCNRTNLYRMDDKTIHTSFCADQMYVKLYVALLCGTNVNRNRNRSPSNKIDHREKCTQPNCSG